jgi:hypothetical protein
MKAVLVIIIVSLTVSSCVTQKKCNEKFPSKRDTIRIETVRDSLVYKDKIVEVKIPGETRIDSVIIPCPPPPPTYIADTAKAETEYARAFAWFSYPRIKLRLEQKASILELKLDSAIKEAYQWRTKFEQITVTPQPVKYIPTFYKYCLGFSIGVILILILILVLKFIKP